MFIPQVAIETSMQMAMIVVPVLFGLLATTAVGLRVLARRIANRRLDASDYLIMAALVVTLCFCGLIAAEPFTGAGMHMQDLIMEYGTSPIVTYTKVWLPSSVFEVALTHNITQMTIANQILWALAVCLPKLSILVLCSRVFTMHAFIIGARVTGATVLLLGVAIILGALLQCRPFAYNWDQTIPGGHCGNQVLSFKITASLNVVLDFVVLLLPMPYLFNLELALKKKLILIATFAGGFM